MHISELELLRDNPMIRFKDEIVDNETVTIVHYMIGNSELWDNPIALETRGNVYNSSGDCICACFQKFFNINERPETQEEQIKNKVVMFQEKKDGSLVTPILTSTGRVLFKTKKSFYSTVATLANECVDIDVLRVSRYYLKQKLTPLFEFTHPESQIVINYGPVPKFTLLAVRCQVTGVELPYSQLKEDIELLNANVQLINTTQFSDWEHFKSTLNDAKGIEGFVLILEDGRRVKAKTTEYLKLHRLYTELRQRDIAEACVDETLDDIIGVLSQSGFDLSPVRSIEHQVISELAQLKHQVEELIKLTKDLSLKEIALAYKDNPLFPLLVKELRGQEADYVTYWKKNYLKNYKLASVYLDYF